MSLQDFKNALKAQIAGPGHKEDTCIVCHQPFTDKNVHSVAGWKEAQISGFCEDCFDDIMEEKGDE